MREQETRVHEHNRQCDKIKSDKEKRVQWTMYKSTMDNSTINKSTMDKSTLNTSTMDKSTMNKSTKDKSTMFKTWNKTYCS